MERIAAKEHVLSNFEEANASMLAGNGSLTSFAAGIHYALTTVEVYATAPKMRPKGVFSLTSAIEAYDDAAKAIAEGK